MNHIPISNSAIDRHAWQSLIPYLKQVGLSEKYFISLGIRLPDKVVHQAFIVPRQLMDSPVRCSIDFGDLAKILTVLSELNARSSSEAKTAVVSWSHSHPSLTVFLSGTDKETLGFWKSWEPNTLAVVIDPFNDACMAKSYWNSHTEIKTVVDDMEYSDEVKTFYDELVEQLHEALPDLEAVFTPFHSWHNAEPSSSEVATVQVRWWHWFPFLRGNRSRA